MPETAITEIKFLLSAVDIEPTNGLKKEAIVRANRPHNSYCLVQYLLLFPLVHHQ